MITRQHLAMMIGLTASIAAQAQETSKPSSTMEGLLDETLIKSSNDPSNYKLDEAPSLLKLDVPVSETPQSVVVIPKQVLQDQGAQTLSDTFRNVSGVFESGNTLNAQAEVLPFIRGFESSVVFRNGLRATQIGSLDLFNIESVEVIKGPASILFGGIEPGGALNYTTKRPQETPFNEFVQHFGSDSYFRSTFDSTGPIDAEGKFLYRINAAYTNSESFRDFMEVERFAIAPSFLWKISEDTELGIDLSYTHDRQPYDTGVPVGFNGEKLVENDTFFNDPSLDGRKLEDLFIGTDLKHRFNDNVTWRSRLQYHRATPTNESIRPRAVGGVPGAEVMSMRYQNEERVDEEWQFVNDFSFSFETGEVRHEAVVGLDLIRQDSDFDRFRVNTPAVPITGFNSGSYSFVPPANSQPAPAFLTESERVSVYFQDQMSMADDRLHILLGGRYDHVEQIDKLPVTTKVTDSAFTARGGILYEATPWMSPYVSVSQSFIPQLTGTADAGGTQLDPETGIQYEVGAKFNFFEERLLATLSLYHLDKEDVAVSDPTFTFYLPGVDQRSSGIELDVTGKITENLSVIANYAYTDTEVTRSETAPGDVGNRLGNVPLNALRVWLAYNFSEGSSLEGLGFGVGARYESERLAAFDNTTLDDFIVFDAGVWYRHELEGGQVLKTQLNIRNLTDQDYYARASTQAIVHPGTPFSVFGSVGIEF